MTTNEKATFHLGPNQRRILKILKKTPNLTMKEIASKVYGTTVMVGDMEYVATSRSLQGLLVKGLVERTDAVVQWRLKAEP